MGIGSAILVANADDEVTQTTHVTVQVDAVVTVYCTCDKCCGRWAELGPDRPTAWTLPGGYSPRKASDLHGCAVDPRCIPYGTVITIPGYGTVIADDTGGAMRRDWSNGVVHIDIRHTGTHSEALVIAARIDRMAKQYESGMIPITFRSVINI